MANETGIYRPWWRTRTFWNSLAGMVTGLGGIISIFASHGDSAKAATIVAGFASVSAFLGNLGSILARQGAVDAVKETNGNGGHTG